VRCLGQELFHSPSPYEWLDLPTAGVPLPGGCCGLGAGPRTWGAVGANRPGDLAARRGAAGEALHPQPTLPLLAVLAPRPLPHEVLLFLPLFLFFSIFFSFSPREICAETDGFILHESLMI